MTDPTEPRPLSRSTNALPDQTSSTILRLPGSRQGKKAHAAASAVSESPLTAGAPSATTPPLAAADSSLDLLFAAFGHDAGCRTAARLGKAVGCRCGAEAAARKSFAVADDERTAQVSPTDDAALTIGLALRYAHLVKPRGLVLPLGIVRALVRHVDAGDPAAVLVWRWCVRNGLIGSVGEARPRLRVAATTEVQP